MSRMNKFSSAIIVTKLQTPGENKNELSKVCKNIKMESFGKKQNVGTYYYFQKKKKIYLRKRFLLYLTYNFNTVIIIFNF